MELMEYNLYLMNEDCDDNPNLSQLINCENPWSRDKYDTNYDCNLLHAENGLDEYSEKNDDEHLNLDNHQDEHHDVDLFESPKDEFKCTINMTESLTHERSWHTDNSKDHRSLSPHAQGTNDPIKLKTQNIDEKYSDPKGNQVEASSEGTIAQREVTNLYEHKINKSDDSSSSSGYNNQIQNFDEGSLIFLIRKIDRKTKKSVLLTKHRKKITKCSHVDLEYYAKGMCKNCYHNKGSKSKKAKKCVHVDRDHYAKGLCKNCYLHFFHIKKRQRVDMENLSSNNQDLSN